MARVERVGVRNLRRIEDLELVLAPGLNLVAGENGAGKTSLIEALAWSARGIGVGTRARDAVGPALGGWSVETKVMREDSKVSTLHSLRFSGGAREQYLDGRPATNVELARSLPLAAFTPNVQAVVSDSPASRIRWVNWCMFHVEPSFYRVWRSYRRALSQRNRLVRARVQGAHLASWSREVARYGEALNVLRVAFFVRWTTCFVAELEELEAGGGWGAVYKRGWAGDKSLAEILAGEDDRLLADSGATRHGPHRADIVVTRGGVGARRRISRGEEKLAGLAILLSLAQQLRTVGREPPVLLLDDLPSELSASSLDRVLRRVQSLRLQVVATGHEWERINVELNPVRLFHVEHGHLAGSEDLTC